MCLSCYPYRTKPRKNCIDCWEPDIWIADYSNNNKVIRHPKHYRCLKIITTANYRGQSLNCELRIDCCIQALTLKICKDGWDEGVTRIVYWRRLCRNGILYIFRRIGLWIDVWRWHRLITNAFSQKHDRIEFLNIFQNPRLSAVPWRQWLF